MIPDPESTMKLVAATPRRRRRSCLVVKSGEGNQLALIPGLSTKESDPRPHRTLFPSPYFRHSEPASRLSFSRAGVPPRRRDEAHGRANHSCPHCVSTGSVLTRSRGVPGATTAPPCPMELAHRLPVRASAGSQSSPPADGTITGVASPCTGPIASAGYHRLSVSVYLTHSEGNPYLQVRCALRRLRRCDP